MAVCTRCGQDYTPSIMTRAYYCVDCSVASLRSTPNSYGPSPLAEITRRQAEALNERVVRELNQLYYSGVSPRFVIDELKEPAPAHYYPDRSTYEEQRVRETFKVLGQLGQSLDFVREIRWIELD